MSDIVELCADTGLSSPAQSLAFWIALTFGVYVFISIVVSSVTIYVVSLEKKHKWVCVARSNNDTIMLQSSVGTLEGLGGVTVSPTYFTIILQSSVGTLGGHSEVGVYLASFRVPN